MIKFDKIHTISNYLSLSRIFLVIPIFYFLQNLEHSDYHRIFAAILMVLAAATDYLDGYFARKYDDVSELGKIIDPLADKIAIGIIVVLLYLNGMLPGFILFVILARDILIFIGGMIISRKIGKVLSSNLLGKITVFVLGVYLLLLVLGLQNYPKLFTYFNYLIVLMSFVSLLGYIVRSVEALRYKKNELL